MKDTSNLLSQNHINSPKCIFSTLKKLGLGTFLMGNFPLYTATSEGGEGGRRGACMDKKMSPL